MRLPRAALAALLVLLLVACEPREPSGGTTEQTWAVPDAEPYRTDLDPKFRTSCLVSHENFSDPIVFPGQPAASHLHRFYGNTSVNWGTTQETLLEGASKCEGGASNRTGYWTPGMLDGGRIIDGAPPGFLDPLQIYYARGFEGVAEEVIQWFPEGLRMIAGADMAKGVSTFDNPKHVWWSCLAPGDPRADANSLRGPTIPACQPGGYLQLAITFPQCWDGVNLDSPDHRSHMAYGTGWRPDPSPPITGCPSSHPVALPEITEFARWWVPIAGTPVDPSTCPGWPPFDPYDRLWPRWRGSEDCPMHPPTDIGEWRLSSDMGAPAGSTAHADWWNGWDPEVGEQIAAGLRQSLDMRMGLVPYPDGVRKLGPAAGP